MADSQGELIMKAILAALNAPSNKPATTYRARIDAISARELPAFVLYALPENVEVAAASTRRRIRKVRLEAHVAGAPPIDSVVDPLYVYAVNTLLADSGLAGLVKGFYESAITWETEPSYEDRCLAAIDFEAHYTTTNDPTVKGLQ
jgi:hypothetical protein